MNERTPLWIQIIAISRSKKAKKLIVGMYHAFNLTEEILREKYVKVVVHERVYELELIVHQRLFLR